MSHSLNKVMLIGNVGRDPEIRTTTGGKDIATFSLATSENWKDRQTSEKKEKTEWHRVVVFSEGLVGIIKKFVKQGTRLYIEGMLQTRKWTDNSGNEKYTTEIVLQNFNSTLLILDGRNTDNIHETSDEKSSSSHTPTNFTYTEEDDSIPF